MINPVPFTSFAGQLLIAMPSIGDPRFHRAVIFICAHDPNGAMGLVLNQPQQGIMFDNMMEQLDIPFEDDMLGLIPVMNGGPVETGRGFVLHGSDYVRKETVIVNDYFSVTATIDILKAMANGDGPHTFSFFLGYAGWQAGQLESELTGHTWLVAPATPQIIFDTPIDEKWDVAMRDLGINPVNLANIGGNA